MGHFFLRNKSHRMRTFCMSLYQIDKRVPLKIYIINWLELLHILSRYLPITILLDNENENVISFPLILPSSSIDRVRCQQKSTRPIVLYIELVTILTVWFQQQQRILDRKEAAVVLKDQVSLCCWNKPMSQLLRTSILASSW